MNKIRRLIVLNLFLILLIPFWMRKIVDHAEMNRLNDAVILSDAYREQNLDENCLTYLQKSAEKGRDVTAYLLETNFGYQAFEGTYTDITFGQLESKWKKQREWFSIRKYNESLWDVIEYFPVPKSTSDEKLNVYYANSWMNERTYGGKRGHEGTDIMANENTPGLFPIVSITDGVVSNIGWLEKGGYRIGITTSTGVYFYYAHLDSYADLEIDDEIKAGDLLGFMGDTGYGPEGTTGMFPVHLHLGIYMYPDGKEISINPYWILRYLEEHKVKCAYSSGDMK